VTAHEEGSEAETEAARPISGNKGGSIGIDEAPARGTRVICFAKQESREAG